MGNAGFDLQDGMRPLLGLKFADDILLFAPSSGEFLVTSSFDCKCKVGHGMVARTIVRVIPLRRMLVGSCGALAITAPSRPLLDMR